MLTKLENALTERVTLDHLHTKEALKVHKDFPHTDHQIIQAFMHVGRVNRRNPENESILKCGNIGLLMAIRTPEFQVKSKRVVHIPLWAIACASGLIWPAIKQKSQNPTSEMAALQAILLASSTELPPIPDFKGWKVEPFKYQPIPMVPALNTGCAYILNGPKERKVYLVREIQELLYPYSEKGNRLRGISERLLTDTCGVIEEVRGFITEED